MRTGRDGGVRKGRRGGNWESRRQEPVELKQACEEQEARGN